MSVLKSLIKKFGIFSIACCCVLGVLLPVTAAYAVDCESGFVHDGYISFRSEANTNLFLDHNTLTNNAAAFEDNVFELNQLFSICQDSDDDTLYDIRSGSDNNMVLTTDGDNVVFMDVRNQPSRNKNSFWRIESFSFDRLKNEGSGKYLTLVGNGNGSNVVVSESVSGFSQAWSEYFHNNSLRPDSCAGGTPDSGAYWRSMNFYNNCKHDVVLRAHSPYHGLTPTFRLKPGEKHTFVKKPVDLFGKGYTVRGQDKAWPKIDID